MSIQLDLGQSKTVCLFGIIVLLLDEVPSNELGSICLSLIR
uniref:Uncharacterized protein n=1 Tax=Anguilla anguilla TaxID=7936 RepID=A0A0E9QDY5_ANGAN